MDQRILIEKSGITELKQSYLKGNLKNLFHLNRGAIKVQSYLLLFKLIT